ncbi:hypothetical protein ACJ41O_012169 [Fusarium nematophilum]
MQAAIIWPEKFLPGTTDNFVSNEVIVRGVTAAQVWPYLVDISQWDKYYCNVSRITPPASGPILKQGDIFKFTTFATSLVSEVTESVAPTTDLAGRIAWRAWHDGGDLTKLEIYHAWIVEDLDWGVVRVLTQESQIGKPASIISRVKPNPMLLGHQSWLNGLTNYAKEKTKTE